MPIEITTISVSPENAGELRAIRDERELQNMDSALGVAIESLRKEGDS